MRHLLNRGRADIGRHALAGVAFLLACGSAEAAAGLSTIPATGDEGRITLFYPTLAEARPITRGPFVLTMAVDAPPAPGNGRLVVLSHGSGAAPWVMADMAGALVDAGFVVALPEHKGDNSRDMRLVGPESWTIRPQEVSRAIDAVGRDPRFASSLKLDKVGVYGMSAGGHTALSLAGGRWSPAGFARHCEAHIAEDFYACVGLATRLDGGPLDGLRKWLALLVVRHRFDDDTPRIDGDPRIAAIVAAVPFAADFDPQSLEHPAVPLALVTARQDRWLTPRFHGDRVLAVCQSCEHLVDIENGGHGALLSPPPPDLKGLDRELLSDPPGFDRAAATAEVDEQTVRFFRAHLLPGS